MNTLITVLVGLIGVGLVNGQGCSSTVTRMEIRSMSTSQLTAYTNAVKKLHTSANSDLYTSFTSNHNNNAAQAHGVPAFFPWHRYFLRQYELDLQKIDPTVVLPYWDWTIDSQAPERSPILSSSMFGGNGQSPSYCVTNGLFSGWTASFPNNHCLMRQYSSGSTIPAFYSPAAIESILSQSKTYDQVHQSIENGPHGAVHVGIGGNNGDLSYMYSPNDPLFYLHHVFIDLLWNEWQLRNPSLANTYNGGNGVSTSNNMIPFNVPVSTVLGTSFGCYTYPRWSGAALPPVSSTTTTTTTTTTKSSPTSTATSTPTTTSTNSNPTTVTNPTQPTSPSVFNPFPTFTPPTFTQPILPTFNFPTFRRRQFDISDIGSSSGGLADYVKKLVGSVPNLVSVPATDRTTPNKIRTPAPLPDSYCESNNLNIAAVRANELLLANLVEAINALS